MAEAAVSLALEKLSDALAQEEVLPHGVRRQVEWLKTDIVSMKSFMKQAHGERRERDERVKMLVSDVREVARGAEDTIDTFILETKSWRRQQRRRSRSVGCIERCAAVPRDLRSRRQLVSDVKVLRAKIQHINQRREMYGLSVGSCGADEDPPARTHGNYGGGGRRDTVVVGLDTHKETIMGYIFDANVTRRRVICIVGGGGIGKTTLATEVYRSRKIRNRHFFDAWAWVSVSQDYRVSPILKSIANQVMESWTEEGDVGDKLYRFLRERRYFIVFDGVWGSSINVWEEIRAVLPDVNNGSRVLVTTTSTDVANSADPTMPPYHLPPLNEDHCWELFLRNTFPTTLQKPTPTTCPEELEEIGRELVNRCQGLPLALVVLGGILSTKDPNPAVWRSMAEEMASRDEDHPGIAGLLRLSYDDLPYYLRFCFLYLASSREDSVIESTKLIRLWIAEGFISHNNKDKTEAIEDTARDYLEELAQRSMIKVIDRDVVDGSITRFQFQDLFRGLCLYRAREIGFLNVYDKYSTMRPDPTRRLALHNLNTDDVSSCWPPSNLRSLLLFDTQVASREILGGLKLLRVIHFEGGSTNPLCGFERLPEEITSMVHLRYLGLRGCRDLRELPPSIGDLFYLQTLDIADTSVSRLPKELGKLEALARLYLPDSCDCPPIIGGNLTSLHANARGGWINPGLGEFVKIRDLRVTGLKLAQEEEFFDSLRKMDGLSSLELLYTELILIELAAGLSSSNQLRRLFLGGTISQGRLPDYSSNALFPPNLTKLTLRRSELERDPMGELEKLPNLAFLELNIMSYVGKVMVCSAGGFLRLQSLVLMGLNGLEDWTVEDGAMPNLTFLTIKYCWRLKKIPQGLKYLTSLQELEVYDDREAFRRRLTPEPEEGEDWPNIRHVHFVTIKDRRLE